MWVLDTAVNVPALYDQGFDSDEAHRFLVAKMKERDHLEIPGVGGGIELKLVLRK
jgi:hypothetical protein